MVTVDNLLMQFFSPSTSKIEVFETYLFDIVTTQKDHPTYVKHVLGRIYVFFTLFGYWVRWGGGVPKGLVHNLLMQFFTLGSSKIEVFEIYFIDIVTTHNDHPRYVKHVLGHIYVFFTFRGGGVSQGIGTQPAYAVLHPWQLKNRSFRNWFFLIL